MFASCVIAIVQKFVKMLTLFFTFRDAEVMREKQKKKEELKQTQ